MQNDLSLAIWKDFIVSLLCNDLACVWFFLNCILIAVWVWDQLMHCVVVLFWFQILIGAVWLVEWDQMGCFIEIFASCLHVLSSPSFHCLRRFYSFFSFLSLIVYGTSQRILNFPLAISFYRILSPILNSTHFAFL